MTRRELMLAALVPVSQLPAVSGSVASAKPPERGRMMLANVPTDLELARWEYQYRARYARDHAPTPYLRGDPSEISECLVTEYDATTMQGAVATLARLEAEVPPDPSVDHAAIAMARGAGYMARRAGGAAADNPYWDSTLGQAGAVGLSYLAAYDLFMAWHAGYVQADPEVKVEEMPGYTPPRVARCVNCGEPQGYFHQGRCNEGHKKRRRVLQRDCVST